MNVLPCFYTNFYWGIAYVWIAPLNAILIIFEHGSFVIWILMNAQVTGKKSAGMYF